MPCLGTNPSSAWSSTVSFWPVSGARPAKPSFLVAFAGQAFSFYLMGLSLELLPSAVLRKQTE